MNNYDENLGRHYKGVNQKYVDSFEDSYHTYTEKMWSEKS